MIHIFFSTIKLHGFEVFISLSFDICLVVFNVPENIFLFHEINLSMSFCTISEANIIMFSFDSSCSSWPLDISECHVTNFIVFCLGLLWKWCNMRLGFNA